MLYEVKLSEPEQRELASLIGNPLAAIATNRWAIDLHGPGRIVHLEPEEVATPDDDHRFVDVERPRVRTVSESLLGEHQYTLAEGLGRVLLIDILSVLISFSAWRSGPAITMPNGAQIPEG